MKEYKDLLAAVLEIEGSMPKPQVGFVRMELDKKESFSKNSPRSFPELFGEIASLDMGGMQQPKPRKAAQIAAAPKPQAPSPQPKPQAQAAPQAHKQQAKKQWIAPALHMPMFRAANPKLQPQQPTPPEQSAPQIDRAPPSPLAAAASSELKKVMSQASIKPQPAQIQQLYSQKASGLILPTLSLSDQISELEKIIENVKQARFDEGQLKIIREEVLGLNSQVSTQQNGALAQSAFEQELIKTRNARLKESLDLIKG